jgi:predicted glycoside hydrolase/deacetylase ChbG (UPF0249 family)
VIRVVVNADDLGLHPRIDEGILRAHAEGIVSSATLLVTGRSVSEAVARALAQKLPLGVHLCLTTHLRPASPASEVRWLAPGGRFRKDWREFAAAWLGQLIPAEEVRVELRAQLALARSLGAEIDHLDTHQHLHLLPGMRRLVEALAAENGLPVRWPIDRPSRRWLLRPAAAAKSLLLGSLASLRGAGEARRVRSHGVFDSGAMNEKSLLRLLRRLEPGDHEIVCHPGLAPGVVPEDPDWRYGWEGEFAAVCSPRVKALIAERGIQLCSFAQLG